MRPKKLARHTILLLKAALGLQPFLPPSGAFGVTIGLATSDTWMIAQSGYARALRGIGSINRHAVSQSNPHAAVGTVAQFLKARGEVHTVSTSCAAGLDAIGLAAREIGDGRASCIVAGGGDTSLDITPLAEFAKAGLASKRNHAPERASRPFDAFADTGVLSDTAGLVIVENLECALARRASILGEVIGYGSCGDPDRNRPGSGYALAMRLALDSAGLSTEEIDYISAWAPGHPVMDRAEAEAIEEVFGDYADEVPVSSIKGVLGNPLSGAGPVQVMMALKGLEQGIIPPTANLEVPLFGVRLNLVKQASLHYDYSTVLINAHGIGGSNVSLVMQKFAPPYPPTPPSKSTSFSYA